MQLLNMPVSERFLINGVLVRTYTSQKHPDRHYAVLATPYGDVTLRIVPDVAVDTCIGHSCTCGVRLAFPEVKGIPKYNRTFLLDTIFESEVF